MKKRFLALLLAICIAASMLVLPVSAAGNNTAVQAAVTLGGRMFGVLGMLVMIPACSVAYALLRQGTERRLRRKRIRKQEP